MIGAYYDALFIGNSYEGQFLSVMEFLVKCLMIQVNENDLSEEDSKKAVVKYQAIETLSIYFKKDNLKDNNFLYIKLQHVVANILGILVQCFTVNSDRKLVNLIIDIISSYAETFMSSNKEFIESLLEKTTDKIFHEIQVRAHEATNARSTICVFDCFNLITEIISNKTIMVFSGQPVQNKLTKIFDLMNSKEEENYDDEVVICAWKIFESTQAVSDYMLLTFTSYLLENKIGSEGFNPPYLDYFNRLILYGKERLAANPDVLDKLVVKIAEERFGHNGNRSLLIHCLIENLAMH
jgi:hypothetical protein